MSIENRLKELQIELPEAPAPVAAYIPCKKSGNLVFVSGQLPSVNGSETKRGKVGAELTVEEGYQAARLCGLNLLAQLRKFLGDLDCVKGIIHVKGFVASDNNFYSHSQVVNGVSDLMVEVFGEAGRHTRCALGTNVLPGNMPVEAELIAEVVS
ncbi:MAG: RidA family protein [Treponema sp.]|jgi:enamine deaminase RidA (YjgF/YER057c/UK114 family)|nr:RidA family protein [Treponema sp.]